MKIHVFVSLLMLIGCVHYKDKEVRKPSSQTFDQIVIEKLLASKQIEGVNCTSGALLAAGKLSVPIFITPSFFQFQIIKHCYREVNDPDEGIIVSRSPISEVNGADHYVLLISDGQFFEKKNNIQAFGRYKYYRNGTDRFFQWSPTANCSLVAFENYIEIEEDKDFNKIATYARNKFGLQKIYESQDDLASLAKNTLMAIREGKKIIHLGVDITYFVERTAKAVLGVY